MLSLPSFSGRPKLARSQITKVAPSLAGDVSKVARLGALAGASGSVSYRRVVPCCELVALPRDRLVGGSSRGSATVLSKGLSFWYPWLKSRGDRVPDY
jgi:hypothetical protein